MKRRRKDTEALNAITAIMDNQPWNTDTLNVIAAIIRATQRPLHPPPQATE